MGAYDWDTLTPEQRRHVMAEYREVKALMARYNISQDEATKLRLAIISGKVPPPEIAEQS